MGEDILSAYELANAAKIPFFFFFQLAHRPLMEFGIPKNKSKENNLGEGNGNPLQYSYLENPMDEGAW